MDLYKPGDEIHGISIQGGKKENLHSDKCGHIKKEFETFLQEKKIPGQYRCFYPKSSVREEICNWVNFNEDVFIDFILVT